MPNPHEYSASSQAEQPQSSQSSQSSQRPDGLPTPERDAASGAVDPSAPSANGHRRATTGVTSAGGASGSRSAARPAFRPVGAPIRVRREQAAEQAEPARESAAAEVVEAVEAVERALLRRLARLWKTVFVNREFALLWWGQAISSVGDYVWDTALVLWIADRLALNKSWAPLAISGVIIAAATPQIVVGPLAGVFVDRWDKRHTLVVSTGLQAVFAILLIPPVLGLHLPWAGSARLPVFWELGVIYADVALITICSQFAIPAQLALIKDIAPEDKEDQAQEMTQALQGLAVVIGPPVAAALVFGVGIGWALLLNSLSFAVSFIAVNAMRTPRATRSVKDGERGDFLRELLDGVRYVLGRTVLRTILVSEALTWLGFGALQTLGYFFITENLHASPSMYGWFGADFGVGAIIGGLLVTFIGQRVGLERILYIALITSGVFVIIMSHVTSFALALVAAFFFGVSATAILVTAGPLAIDATERRFIGRVMAVLNPTGRLAAFISVVLTGALVSTVLAGFHADVLGIHFGPVDTVFTGTGLLAVAGGLYVWRALASSPSPQHEPERRV